MFTIKLFRGGTKEPEQVEFYSTETPVVIPVNDRVVSYQVETSVSGRRDLIDINHGDTAFIENGDGVTIHSIR